MSHDLDGEGRTQHALAPVTSTGARIGGAVPNSVEGGGGVQMGRWKGRGLDRKRDGVSTRDK